MFVVFFFSSRRRHTRSKRDWSSDVCSSDLSGGRMLVQNADGSIPEMCGNGARCAALWIATDGCTRPANARVELLTDAGPRPCTVDARSPTQGLVEVDMGTARIEPARRLSRWEGLPVRSEE